MKPETLDVRKEENMRTAIKLLMIVALAGFSIAANAQTMQFTDNWSPNPLFTLVNQSDRGVELIFSTQQVMIEEREVDGITMQHYGIPGIFLSNDEGAPDLPGTGRWLAVPQGAKAILTIIDARTEILHNVEICPAPNNPPENNDSPLSYVKNSNIYETNAYYPESPVRLSDPTQIRGVDAVIVGVTPMQYNPVTKDLIIYKDIRFKVDFEGGNSHFGEDRLRSRYWEQILQGQFINYTSLPRIDFYTPERTIATDNVEYIIIIPNDTIFAAWADTLKNWRQLQGISTSVFTLAQIGGTDSAHIKAFLRNAYNTWSPAPVAFLILSDFPSSGMLLNYGVTSPRVTHPDVTRMTADNWYADFNNDGLPELHIARICAKTQAHLSTIINKMLNYERNPPTAANYYNNPLVACGWQTERWFQLCAEVVRGFFITGLGKSPARQYKVYEGTPTVNGVWSTATNTSTVVNYWHTVGWLTATTNPNNPTWWNNGNATGINTAINAGAFIVQHRDHGAVEGWGEPSYDTTNLNGLDNSLLPYVFTTNCETGYFDNARQSFTEKFHRMTGGALGLNAATRISYSFVNDVFCWGMYDCMWPQFDPNYPIINSVGYPNLRPAFANSYGKYYLAAHSWPYNTQHKQVTYGLFHHHGDPFMTLFAAIPETLTISHESTIGAGLTSFTVTANDSSLIALTAAGEILGVAEGTGGPVSITIPALSMGDTMVVTVTKAAYRRYSALVQVATGALTPLNQAQLGPHAMSTSIAAYHDSIICVFDQPGTVLNSRLVTSNDGGLNWTPGYIDDTTLVSHSAKAIGSDGNIGVAYLANENPRQGRFIQLENGLWSTPSLYSDIEPVSVKQSAEYLGDNGYGVIYIAEDDQCNKVAFFDHLEVGGGCDYVLGDINSDGQHLGSDVTYAVRYFKGLGFQPPDSCFLDSAGIYYYPAGDINGNCEFRGSDITRLIAVMFGHATISYCHWNPPSNPPRIRHGENIIQPSKID
jgi:hypothetical protein